MDWAPTAALHARTGSVDGWSMMARGHGSCCSSLRAAGATARAAPKTGRHTSARDLPNPPTPVKVAGSRAVCKAERRSAARRRLFTPRRPSRSIANVPQRAACRSRLPKLESDSLNTTRNIRGPGCAARWRATPQIAQGSANRWRTHSAARSVTPSQVGACVAFDAMGRSVAMMPERRLRSAGSRTKL